MKYILIILIPFSCLGQYPKLRISDTGKVYRLLKDSGSYWFTKPGNDTLFVVSKTYIKDTIIYSGLSEIPYDGIIYSPDETNDKDWSILQTAFDSSKYYWKKQVYWEQRMNKELERLNKFKKPQLSQRLLDYQDSCIKFKLLLEQYKK